MAHHITGGHLDRCYAAERSERCRGRESGDGAGAREDLCGGRLANAEELGKVAPEATTAPAIAVVASVMRR